jgi:hypothetical protein
VTLPIPKLVTRCRGGSAAVLLALMLLLAMTPVARAADPEPGDGDTASKPRRAGGGFEFRRKLSTVDNPYCAITTYVVGDFPEQATSTTDAAGRPAIVVDASELANERAYSHFLMAHECCHHILGHVRLTSNKLGQLGPQPFYYVQPLLRGMELDADACATRMLTFTKEPDAIEAARGKMLEFGNAPTGAYYPTGVERADNIAHTATER